jgi:hypothetical protein
VGKGEEMSLVESSLTDEEEVGERPQLDGDSCRTMIRVNEDYEKLQNSIIKEKDNGSILIVRGVEIFLPSGRGEASIDVTNVTGR